MPNVRSEDFKKAAVSYTASAGIVVDGLSSPGAT